MGLQASGADGTRRPAALAGRGVDGTERPSGAAHRVFRDRLARFAPLTRGLGSLDAESGCRGREEGSDDGLVQHDLSPDTSSSAKNII
jgi:hypothetical protein